MAHRLLTDHALTAIGRPATHSGLRFGQHRSERRHSTSPRTAAKLDSPDRQLLIGKQAKADICSSEQMAMCEAFMILRFAHRFCQQRYSLSAGQAKVGMYVSYHELS